MKTPQASSAIRKYAPWMLMAAFCVLAFCAYYPGLSGSFMLDDWGTLPALGAYGPVNNFDTLISYLTSGIAGPGGRPISLLSFLIDAHNWPAHPWAFKLTNVILQLINGVLLAWLLTSLSQACGLSKRRSAWTGIIAAALWMAHPLFVSTTLYVVQRMAMLAAFFVFLGLILYLAGRKRLNAGHTRRGYILMTTGIVAGTVLGFFSKENAAILPLLALVLEATVLRQRPVSVQTPPPLIPSENNSQKNTASQEYPKSTESCELTYPAHALSEAHEFSSTPSATAPALWFRIIFLWLPSAAIIGYLLWYMRDLTVIAPGRDFSIGTRLLTESRVLVYYLYLIFIPHGETHGLYTVVKLSHNLLAPWTTLPSILLITGLVAGAFLIRRRWPIIAAALLFFFAGHLVESTSIPLEIYYEHRNYLPAALLFWPLAVWLMNGEKYRYLKNIILVLSFLVLFSLTGYRSHLWGQPQKLALNWMRLNPLSARAIVTGTDVLIKRNETLKAYSRLVAASKVITNDNSIALARISAACELGAARPEDIKYLLNAARYGQRGLHLIYKDLPQLIGNNGACPGFGDKQIEILLINASKNKHFQSPGARQKIGILQGQLMLAMHKNDMAYTYFLQALRAEPTPDAALTESAYLLNADLPMKAKSLIKAYKKLPQLHPDILSMHGLHRRWLDHIGWYKESFANIRSAIKGECSRSCRKSSLQQQNNRL